MRAFFTRLLGLVFVTALLATGAAWWWLNEPLTLNLDGEPVESRHFRIDCVPGRLRMHVPADSPLLS